LEQCGPCSVFADFTLAFALQLRKTHGEISVRIRKENIRQELNISLIVHRIEGSKKNRREKIEQVKAGM
jgi:hypothetical protein